MDWLKRIGYFLIGVSISCVGVYFFWQKKQATFDYGMDARTLKTIRIRKQIISPEAQTVLTENNLDSIAIMYILNNGDVNFGKSQQREKPCGKYLIEGEFQDKLIDLWIIRCDSTATIKKVTIK
jgi:hypothetical protein